MKNQNSNTYQTFKWWKVFIPIILGLGVVMYFILKDFNQIDFSLFKFTKYSLYFVLLAFVMLIFRDIGYVLRIRILSSAELSWKQCIKIILLWEFGSAITPSAVGGTAMATVFLWKEGMSVGKSSAIVLATSFLDELYFSLMFPLIILIIGKSGIFISGQNLFLEKLFWFAIVGYCLKLAWTIIIGYSLFINPKIISNLLKKLFSFRLLRKWKNSAEKVAEDYVLANKEFKNKSIGFWLKSFFASFISWTSRYLVLNALFIALAVGNFKLGIFDHFLIFARQLVMWIIMLIMPSPGGSGFVEAVFSSLMVDFVGISGFAIVMALVWRLFTYYPYLIIGAILAPHWLNKKFKKAKKKAAL
ncbi:MAG: flippase-like domain-containing protein [Bacteroidales bacterium]|nr:flippase-like domain-containing protein [Bacteroidales bacterium]MCK9498059.1 flippase-like domain-containing protein [Bacteroidales bacterium]MDY0314281.1 lysylphosphatidylglycerol synthase transmembrane domain-containing protein [Bacteroidales bacterium]